MTMETWNAHALCAPLYIAALLTIVRPLYIGLKARIDRGGVHIVPEAVSVVGGEGGAGDKTRSFTTDSCTFIHSS